MDKTAETGWFFILFSQPEKFGLLSNDLSIYLANIQKIFINLRLSINQNNI